MKIGIAGGKGMLGTDLAAACAQAGIEYVVLDLPEFDICKPDNLIREIPAVPVVLNCAAFTRVDDAEKERDLCMAINGKGAGHLARACAARGIRLIHISTDYVFDGRKGSPYLVTDPTSPLSFYGESKLAGEREVTAAGGAWTIVRTQSLYGLGGRNFIKAILNQILKGNKELRVVNDQVSSPTYTRHLAEGLLHLVRAGSTGLVHVASRGSCSWFDFALAILREVGVTDVQVHPRSTAELNYPALRPAYSVLDTSVYTSLTGQIMPTWEKGLQEYLQEEPLAKQLT